MKTVSNPRDGDKYLLAISKVNTIVAIKRAVLEIAETFVVLIFRLHHEIMGGIIH